MKTYDIDDARAILRNYIKEWVEFDARGVVLSQQSLDGVPAELLQWKYACELDGPDAPNPLTAPCLPFPFNANELAAFMLDGIGAGVASNYGSWENGPDAGMLNSMGVLAREPQKALVDAYAAYRQAERAVGKLDPGLEIQRIQLADEFNRKNLEANTREGVWTQDITPDEARTRRERAVASVAELQELGDQARNRYDSAFSVWRRAMVHQLLRPLAGHQSPDVTLAVQIDGRYALPVRAIPFVTGWPQPFGISPDSLAKTLGRHPNERTPFDGLRTSSAYKMYLGKSVAVRPEEWNMVVVQLEGFSADLEARFPEDEQGRRDARGYAAWQANAAQKLPSGVFVWLDELEKDFHRHFDWKARQVGADSLGSRDLNLAPLLLSDDVRRMVSEGFEEFTGTHGNPSANDRALASKGATANDGDRAIKLEAMLEQQNDPTHELMVKYAEAVCIRNERALGRKSLIENADDENTISGILRKESELLNIATYITPHN